MDRINVLLADDDDDSLDSMRYFIEKLPAFRIVGRFGNGEQLVDSMLGTNPDVVILDIDMPRMNGIEAIRTCLSLNPELPFIFISGNDEYAVQAFELSALDYLVKPIERSRLYAALKKVSRARRGLNGTAPIRTLTVKEGNDFYFIPVDGIVFLEKVGRKCHIHTSEKTVATTATIGNIAKQLPPDRFFMSHRSFIINLNKLSHILANNQTYLAYFSHSDKHAHVSKLKIEELQKRMRSLN